LDGTPLAVERIKHAWPGLPISDRAYLLVLLLAGTFTDKERKTIRWSHHRSQLVDLALADGNAYIRYLAAKDVSKPFKSKDEDATPRYLADNARFEKVKSDSVALVRSAYQEQGRHKVEVRDAASFWKRPQTERLALVNGVKEDGGKIAELLRYATKDLLPMNAVTLEEILDVLLQYLGGQTITDRVAESEDNARFFCDGFYELHAGNSVKALWEVIPDLPGPLSEVLIECLPEEAGFGSTIPPHVVESLDEHHLELLLLRDDITLHDLRRKLYKESTHESLRQAAVTSRRFKLLDTDITELVYGPGEPLESGKKKVDELAMLANSCQGATLAQMQAICDLIGDAPTDFHSGFGKLDSIGFGRMHQSARAKGMSPDNIEYEILEMRLFALAKELAPIKEGDAPRDLPEKLIRYKGQVIPHNPWQTYLNLKKVVDLDRLEETIGYLPEVDIQDFDLPDEPGESGKSNQTHRELLDLVRNVQGRINDESENLRVERAALDHAVSSITDVTMNGRAELSALSKELSNSLGRIAGVENGTVQRIEALQKRIEKLSGIVNIVLWLTGAVLLFVLFK
jgi:hypothetical protein